MNLFFCQHIFKTQRLHILLFHYITILSFYIKQLYSYSFLDLFISFFIQRQKTNYQCYRRKKQTNPSEIGFFIYFFCIIKFLLYLECTNFSFSFKHKASTFCEQTGTGTFCAISVPFETGWRCFS